LYATLFGSYSHEIVIQWSYARKLVTA
jgi:hypothetical protein